jgi:hypothetical protein
MTFQLSEQGFECETINNEMYFISFDIIQSISSYSSDIFTDGELRLEIETTDYEIYTFSEREDGWTDLTTWVKGWANLADDWATSSDDEVFSAEPTLLWKNTDHLE